MFQRSSSARPDRYRRIEANCYVQSAGAHTFYFNEGISRSGEPYLACQLFNTINANAVSHGYGYCDVYYGGGEYVTARVYNQSGSGHVISGTPKPSFASPLQHGNQ
jgi:hypothetical protein